MKERFLDVIKWGLILVIAGGVYYGLDNIKRDEKTQQRTQTGSYRYFLAGGGQGVAYKLDRKTGEVWLVTPAFSKLVQEEKKKEQIHKGRRQEAKNELEKPKDLLDKIDFEKEQKDERLERARKLLEGWERGTGEITTNFTPEKLAIEFLEEQRKKYKSLSEIEKAYREELLQKEKEKRREKQRKQRLSQILEMMDRVDAEFEARENK
jgi:hypothetical protein